MSLRFAVSGDFQHNTRTVNAQHAVELAAYPYQPGGQIRHTCGDVVAVWLCGCALGGAVAQPAAVTLTVHAADIQHCSGDFSCLLTTTVLAS